MFYNVHKLIELKKQQLCVPQSIREYYFQWKKLLEDMNISDTTDMNSFITGFILGNNVMLREKFLELRRKEKENETRN
jgi:hypothetical protein